MGMSAHYYAYAQGDIEAIKNGGDSGALDEYDLDKMWDAMHKTLTGKNMFEAMSAGEIFATPNPLSWAIFGRGMAGEEGGEAISYVGADDVKAVAKAMQSTDIGALLANVNFTDFGAAGTYPEIWEYESEFEDIKAELKEYFIGLLNFYQNAADKGLGVLIVIA
ncbi:YfbM family protein [uncultured Campylobacter sp.]|uniref:YfbM family protein n=1 Tax=uncultured Campylobacter sp. TaxID=218934 RepID=UPI0025F9D579|nr:YfbM family protein [uncultured Campylobacter sp.]